MSSGADPDALELDILLYLKDKERSGPVYKGKSPQLHQRRIMVDWICLVVERFKLSGNCAQLSVKLYDLFLDSYEVEEYQLKFIATGCLLLAAKVEEKDDLIPRISSLQPLLSQRSQPQNYTRSQFIRLEYLLLDHFDFNLNLPTASLFCDILTPFGVSRSDAISGSPITDFNLLVEKFKEFVRYFLDVSLQCSEFVGERSSTLASSVMFCARKALRLKPTWTRSLKCHTGFKHAVDFAPISRRLLAELNETSDSEIFVVVDVETPPPRKKLKVDAVSPDDGYTSGLGPRSGAENDSEEDEKTREHSESNFEVIVVEESPC